MPFFCFSMKKAELLQNNDKSLFIFVVANFKNGGRDLVIILLR